MLAFAPIFLHFIPIEYYSASEIYYKNAGGQGLSLYTDFLKMNVPILSIIGYLGSALKLYYEPMLAISISFADTYSWIEFYIEVLFFIAVIRSHFCLFRNPIIFSLFIFFNVLVCSLPFTHSRYLMPMLVALIIYYLAEDLNRVKRQGITKVKAFY